MNGQDYEQLTLFQEDSPASRSALPGNEMARKMTAISGQKCCELLKKSGRLGCLVKMCLESSIWHSTRCYLTWKPLATPHKRLLFQLAVQTPHTEDTDALFWHTPKASDAVMGMTAKTRGRPITKSTHLQTQVYCVEHGLLPTPKASATLGGCSGARKTLDRLTAKGYLTEEERKSLCAGNGGKTNPEFLEWLMGYEQKFTELIPTPRASDYKGAAANRFYSQNVQVERERERGSEIPAQSVRIGRSHSAWENWPDESGLDRVVDGVPNRVDRLKCLGNAVVPQQFFPFFYYIAKIEKGETMIPDDPIIASIERTGYPPWMQDEEEEDDD